MDSKNLAARDRLLEFHNLYVDFVTHRRADHPGKAFDVQMEMARKATTVQRDLDNIGQQPFLLKDAPAAGGTIRPVSLTGLIVNPQLADEYNVEPNSIVTALMAAIGEYENRGEGESAWSTALNALWPVARAPFNFVRGSWRLGVRHRILGALAASVTAAASTIFLLQWIFGLM